MNSPAKVKQPGAMHPTPAEIRQAIVRRLDDDFRKNPYGGDVPAIPVRVHRLIDEAVTEACNAKAAQ